MTNPTNPDKLIPSEPGIVTPRLSPAQAEQVDEQAKPAVKSPAQAERDDEAVKSPLRMKQVVAAVAVGFLAVVVALLVDWLLFRPANADAWADVIRSTALALAFMAAVPAGYVGCQFGQR